MSATTTSRLARGMALGALGPSLTFFALFLLPVVAAALLSPDEFAMWAILGTVTTISVTLDLGGTTLVMARWRIEPRRRLLLRATALSTAGSVAVGLVAAAAFVPFSATLAAAAFTTGEGIAAIGVVTFGCCLRSAVLVLAQAALSEERYHARTCLFTVQAFAATGIALAVAGSTGSAWGLPVGWLVSSSLTLVGGLVWASRDGLVHRGVSEPVGGLDDHGVARFAWARSTETVLSSILVQSDRWIVGALAGPEFLGAYEIASRVASLPKFLSFQLAPSLARHAVESALVEHRPEEVRTVMRRGLVICAVAMAAASTGFAGAYPVVAAFSHVASLPGVFTAMLGAYFLYGLTSPVTVVGISVDRPAIDVPFLGVALGVALVAAVLGFATGDVAIYVFGNLAALALGCAWFFATAPGAVLRRARSLAPVDRSSPTVPDPLSGARRA